MQVEKHDLITSLILESLTEESGLIIAELVNRARGLWLTESGIRSRILTLERRGLIRCERRFGRTYCFPVEE